MRAHTLYRGYGKSQGPYMSLVYLLLSCYFFLVIPIASIKVEVPLGILVLFNLWNWLIWSVHDLFLIKVVMSWPRITLDIFLLTLVISHR